MQQNADDGYELMHMQTIAIANQKGGCGRTTTAVNLGAALAKSGKKTLIVDLDPQHHATIGLRQNPEALPMTMFDVLTNPETAISQAAQKTNVQFLHLAGADVSLRAAERALDARVGGVFILSEKLDEVQGRYDFCLIDCPGRFGPLTLAGMVAAENLLVPVQAHYYGMEGLESLFDMVEATNERFDPCSISVLGLLLTFVQESTSLSREVQQQMRDRFGDLVFETAIHLNTKLAEAPGAGESVITYAPKSRGAREYKALAEEIVHRKGRDKTKGSNHGQE